MKTIAILGDDKRYEYMLPLFINKGWSVHTVGNTAKKSVQYEQHETVKTLPLKELTIILLPVQGITEINQHNFQITDDFWREILPTTILVTGIMTSYLRKHIQRYDQSMIALFDANDIAIYNAVPTAEGILQIAMEETNRTIHGMAIVLFGYGRVGQTIAHLFQAVGAKVTVLTNDDTEIARARTSGLIAKQLEEQIDYHSFDLMINTIPAPIISKKIILQCQQIQCIIDIASGSGGIKKDAKQAASQPIIHATGLPSKVAIQTASDIIANGIFNKTKHLL